MPIKRWHPPNRVHQRILELKVGHLWGFLWGGKRLLEVSTFAVFLKLSKKQMQAPPPPKKFIVKFRKIESY